MSTIIQLSIVPMDKGESISPYVARAVAVIRQSGLAYELGPMGTCIEGDWNAVMRVVNQCFEALQTDCDRIYLTVKADYRKGRSLGLGAKVKSVMDKIVT